MRMMTTIPDSELDPVLHFVGSLAELSRLLGVTPQALYVRRRKHQPLVTALEAAHLLRDHAIPLHKSRPDIFPKLRKA